LDSLGSLVAAIIDAKITTETCSPRFTGYQLPAGNGLVPVFSGFLQCFGADDGSVSIHQSPSLNQSKPAAQLHRSANLSRRTRGNGVFDFCPFFGDKSLQFHPLQSLCSFVSGQHRPGDGASARHDPLRVRSAGCLPPKRFFYGCLSAGCLPWWDSPQRIWSTDLSTRLSTRRLSEFPAARPLSGNHRDQPQHVWISTRLSPSEQLVDQYDHSGADPSTANDTALPGCEIPNNLLARHHQLQRSRSDGFGKHGFRRVISVRLSEIFRFDTTPLHHPIIRTNPLGWAINARSRSSWECLRRFSRLVLGNRPCTDLWRRTRSESWGVLGL